jgi:hypothetical protein
MIENETILDVQEKGYCVLREHLPKGVIEACRDAFWPILLTYLKDHSHEPNRGPHRHFLPMPFDSPCFAPEFFFDADVLNIVRSVMDERVVPDQWGCDVPLRGSEYQRFHVDYCHESRFVGKAETSVLLPASLLSGNPIRFSPKRLRTLR